MSVHNVSSQSRIHSHKPPQGRKGASHNEPQDRLERGRPPEALIRPDKNARAHKNKYAHFSKAAQAQANLASVHLSSAAGILGGLATAQLLRADGKWSVVALAEKALREHGLETEVPADVQAQVTTINAPAKVPADATWARDMRDKPWTSIDNPTSQDLDQLAYSERLPNGDIKMYVAVTNVRALVPRGSALDLFMDKNTTSIYTADRIFPLMPDKLSCDLISLNPGQDRFANIIEYTVHPDGSVSDENCYQGLVNNHAKLNYPNVNQWIGQGSPDGAALEGLEGDDSLKHTVYDQLRMQDEAARRLQSARDLGGALNFETTDVRVRCQDGIPVGWDEHELGPANKIVENQMVTANQVMSRFLRARGYPTIERVVAKPEKWDQIVNLAADHGFSLPASPDGLALREFLDQQQQLAPAKFEDLSGQVIRMIGRGKYVYVAPGDVPPGHFGMGIENYVQSTAQMRRRGDQINADIFEAALRGQPCPYSEKQLQEMAENLTDKEEMAKLAERQANKAAMAVYLSDHIGEHYDAHITSVRDGMVFVRVGTPPFEAPIPGMHAGEVGRHLRVRLDSVDPEQARITLKRA